MKTARRIFLVLFVLSTLGVLLMFVFSNNLDLPAAAAQTPEVNSPPSVGDPSANDPSAQNSVNVNFTALAGSLVASVTSLVGFITTTAITWRKEQREAALADVERKKLELELERNRLELKELKKSRLKKKSEK